MSRVTIDNIVDDYDANRYPYDGGRIEIVPRKMVEMLLERCQEEIDSYTLEDVVCSNPDHNYANGKLDMAYEIRDYAKRLLKQFEEDDE